MVRGALVLLAVLLGGCNEVIFCVGSSLTFGTPGIGGPGKEPPGEGYCEKLQRKLVNVRTVNRGISASTAAMWGTVAPATQATLWWAVTCTGGSGCPELPPLWPDAPGLGPWEFAAIGGTTFGEKVLRVGTRAGLSPHIVVNLIGLNDRAVHGSTAADAFAEHRAILASERALRVQGFQPYLVVMTEIADNARCGGADPGCDVPYVEAYNAMLREAYGATRYPDPVLLDLSTEFAIRGGTIGPDGLHPDAHGYDVMADAVADFLVSRGLARRAACPG